jgi:hypothetical protein
VAMEKFPINGGLNGKTGKLVWNIYKWI